MASEGAWGKGEGGEKVLPFIRGYSACAQGECSISGYIVNCQLLLMMCPARSLRANQCKCLNANTHLVWIRWQEVGKLMTEITKIEACF